MGNADNPVGADGQSQAATSLPASADLVILGGGIMGLWAAVKAERRGIRTVLVDAGKLGQGTSGGLLGALMPHMPDRWNDKKQLQFDALLALEDEVAALEAATGLSCGYRRSGRLIPLPKPHLRDIALRHSAEAEMNWGQGERKFHWHVIDAPLQAGWPDEAVTQSGLVFDTFAGRVSPRRLIASLAAFLRAARHVTIVENCAASHIDAAASRIQFTDGRTIVFGKCIVAAGNGAFPLIGGMTTPPPAQPLGKPVKGQAALLKADIDPALPLLYLNGLYLVPHDDGHVALGSTSEEEFDAPYSTDSLLDDLLARASELVPALGRAEVVERWAGLRPKAIGREPMVGPHPDHANVIALAGGFKVSFGIAHRLADAALNAATGGDLDLPQSYLLSDHLALISR